VEGEGGQEEQLHRHYFALPKKSFFADSNGLRRGSVAARLLRLQVRIPPVHECFVSRECCVLSGTDLCDELITRPEES